MEPQVHSNTRSDTISYLRLSKSQAAATQTHPHHPNVVPNLLLNWSWCHVQPKNGSWTTPVISAACSMCSMNVGAPWHGGDQTNSVGGALCTCRCQVSIDPDQAAKLRLQSCNQCTQGVVPYHCTQGNAMIYSRSKQKMVRLQWQLELDWQKKNFAKTIYNDYVKCLRAPYSQDSRCHISLKKHYDKTGSWIMLRHSCCGCSHWMLQPG